MYTILMATDKDIITIRFVLSLRSLYVTQKGTY